MTIFDFFNAEEIAAYWEEATSNSVPYLGKTLFPPKKQLGLELSWIKGKGGLPVAMTPSNFDAKATLRDRIGFSKIETELPFFREAMRIGEKDRQELNKVMAANNRALVDPILGNIFDDVAGLVDGAEVNAERMRMQLLSTGLISIQGNRLAYDYDYQMDSNHKLTLSGTDAWSDSTNATPVDDIRTAQDTVEDDTGERPERALATRKTFNYLINSDQILNDMEAKGYVGNSNAIINESLVRRYLLEELGLEVVVYNKKFATTVKNQSAELFFPDDVFTLLPTGTLGNTYYGTTPEESDLMAGVSDAQVQIVDTGVAITTKKESHPVNVQTIVSGIFLPSFEQIDKIFIINVNG
jgi:hypothetical protein